MHFNTRIKLHFCFQEDPLNQTLTFDAGHEIRFWNRDEAESEDKPEENIEANLCVKRKVWDQKAPQTLLNILANMEVSSVCSTFYSECGVYDMKNIHCALVDIMYFLLKPF